eukprot:COSAG01_NODE_62529_length_284_cov_0.740541_1_plen_28_part_10
MTHDRLVELLDAMQEFHTAQVAKVAPLG